MVEEAASLLLCRKISRVTFHSCTLLLIIALQLPIAAFAQESINQVQFSDAFTSALYRNENECTSSLGLSMAFSLVYPSSTGNSEREIRTILGYPENSRLSLVWDDISTRIDDSFEGVCLSQFMDNTCNRYAPIVEIANSVWVDDDTTLNAEYASVVGGYLRQIDFEDLGAGGRINDWVRDSTNGLIESVVQEGTLSQYVSFVVNSIYLRASWENQFSEQQTNQDLFYRTASRMEYAPAVEARFMHQVEDVPYSHDVLSGFQVLKLNFVSTLQHPLSMVFVLPMTDASGFATSSDVLRAIPQLPTRRVAMAIPKFKFERTYEDSLKSALRSMGMSAPFLGELCIDNSINCDEYIDLIIQKTIIDVNEMGVEAAAVTVMGMRTTSVIIRDPPPVFPFEADHPFQFFIYDETEDLILFEGRVGNPGIDANEPPSAAMNARHSDTFWYDNYRIQVADLPFSAGPVNLVRRDVPPNFSKMDFKYGLTNGRGGGASNLGIGGGGGRRLKGQRS